MKILLPIVLIFIFAGCKSTPAISDSTNPRSPSQLSRSEIIFIFALHNKIPEIELDTLLSSIDPDVVLVEIAQEDVGKRDFGGSPREMIQALQWSQSRRKFVAGFDCPMKTKPDNYTKQTDLKITSDMQEFGRKYNWRDANKISVAHELAVILIPFTDSQKMDTRHGCMLQNIQASLPRKGRALILTGAYHSDFFRDKFPDAKFPATAE
jgi:hypothetical protein